MNEEIQNQDTEGEVVEEVSQANDVQEASAPSSNDGQVLTDYIVPPVEVINTPSLGTIGHKQIISISPFELNGRILTQVVDENGSTFLLTDSEAKELIED